MRNIPMVVGTIFLLSVLCGVYLWKNLHPAETVVNALYSGQYVRASRLLAAPAEQGNSDAQLMLGNLYYVGLGAKKDYTTAAYWYERAGMQGNSIAQHNMALIYQQGLGQNKNVVAAAAWFLLADSGGNPASETYLRTISGSLNPNKIQEAQKMQEDLASEMSGR